jgi:Zn-dependent peptidase ImmA (M78 family)/DNA-binding XRE family transcriptional regulator
MKDLIGHNLKTAREAAGLSQEQLAQKLGVSRATLSAIENGHAAIDSTKLIDAARLLGRPVADFFSEKIEELALLYRAAENAVAPESALIDFERFCRAYRELEEIAQVADKVLPPPEYGQEAATAKPLAHAALVAESERQRLGIGPVDPLENLFKLLDKQGVRIFSYALEGHDVFGMSAYSTKYGPCVLLNATNTVERQIFSLAHEYGHLLMHRRMYRAPAPQEPTTPDALAEQMADVFAAHFLVPATALRAVVHQDIGKADISVEDIVFLKRHFRVSAKMIYKRLVETRCIKASPSLAREIEAADPKREIAPMGKDIIKDWEKFRRFEHLARKASNEQTITMGKLAEILGQTLLETRKKAQQWQRELGFA